MGKRSIKAYLNSMTEYMAVLRAIAMSCVHQHPKMFFDVESTNSQVAGFMLSMSFSRDKDTGKVSPLSMDAWLGHSGKPHATLTIDYKGNVTLEEKNV